MVRQMRRQCQGYLLHGVSVVIAGVFDHVHKKLVNIDVVDGKPGLARTTWAVPNTISLAVLHERGEIKALQVLAFYSLNGNLNATK